MLEIRLGDRVEPYDWSALPVSERLLLTEPTMSQSTTLASLDAIRAVTDARVITDIASYHAHVYYEMATSRPDAALLADRIAALFKVHMTSLCDKPIGPHPWPMFEAAFDVALFSSFVPWLMLNRRGLNILIHPNTDDMYADHVILPIWLGDKLPLKAEGMPRTGALAMMSGRHLPEPH